MPASSASLAYGRVDEEGIRCPYHGWKYASDGECLEQPPEPPQYRQKIRQPAYPVQKLAGLLFAYMDRSRFPCCRVGTPLAREDGKRWVTIESVIDCNWLQAMENWSIPRTFIGCTDFHSGPATSPNGNMRRSTSSIRSSTAS